MNVAAEQDLEHRVAVLTNWGFWGVLGAGFVLSGFEMDFYFLALFGFALLVAGFVAHLIVNRIYAAGFRTGEVAAGFGIFGVAVLAFIVSWLLDPTFSDVDVLSGITGIVVVIGSFLVYVATRFGLKGSFSMFHTDRG